MQALEIHLWTQAGSLSLVWEFHNSTAQSGLSTPSVDSSLFTYKDGPVIAFVLLYVDDIVLTSNNSSFITQLILNLNKVLELKDMGTLSYFLGLQI